MWLEANSIEENKKESKKSLFNSNEPNWNKQMELRSFEVLCIQMKHNWCKSACDITNNLMQEIGSQLHCGKSKRIIEKPIGHKQTY